MVRIEGRSRRTRPSIKSSKRKVEKPASLYRGIHRKMAS